jgi:hypothetical protein
MARTQELYELDHRWREVPQKAFWNALERTTPDIWGKLGDLARAWAENAPSADVAGIKVSYYSGVNGTLRMHECLFPPKIVTEHGIFEQTFIPGSGSLSPEFRAARTDWQRAHGLDTPWLSMFADLHILQEFTGLMLLRTSMHGVVGREPTLKAGNSPADYARRSEDHYRTAVAPYYGLTRVQRIEAPHHLEWTVLYQCERMSFQDIAGAHAEKWGRDHPNEEEMPREADRHVRTVEKAVKKTADVVQLPLRKLPKGRKSKN